MFAISQMLAILIILTIQSCLQYMLVIGSRDKWYWQERIFVTIPRFVKNVVSFIL